MSYTSLLNDSCVIQTRTVDTSGKTDTESWVAQAPTRCRALKKVSRRQSSPEGAMKVQYAVYVAVNFALPNSSNVAKRDRIVHDGLTYDVIEVQKPRDRSGRHHKVAVCDVLA